MKHTSSKENSALTNCGAGGTGAAGGAAEVAATVPAAGAADGSQEKKNYKLTPRTHPLPKRVQKLLVSYLRTRARAGAMFAEASEKLLRAMNETRGSGHEKVIVPGLVYAFSEPVNIDGKLKSTVQVQDNFTQPEVVKVTRVTRYDVKTWKGDGPAAERDERAAVKSEE